MPELPEVETVVRQLGPLLKRRRLLCSAALDEKLTSGALGRCAGCSVTGVSRVGKHIVIEFSAKRRSPVFLIVHLRMTGRLIWRAPKTPGAAMGRFSPAAFRRAAAKRRAEEKHLRAIFFFEGGELCFVDARRFGTINCLRSLAGIKGAGIDPVNDELSPGRLCRLLAGSRQPVKSWLLRQDRLVGLGNIYASEILHRAGIDPRRHAGSLDQREAARLLQATRRVLCEAIAACGTTFSDFQDAAGVEGTFGRFLRVYQREGKSCRRCRSPVRRIVQQGRSTYYCAGCQR